jgi:putative transposase
LYRKPNTSKKHPSHPVFPYLLRESTIERANQAWALDNTYIPMARGWVYLVAVLDWASRRVLTHRVSITMEADFCVEALQEAAARWGAPEIVNTDQGSQFSSADFVAEVKRIGRASSPTILKACSEHRSLVLINNSWWTREHYPRSTSRHTPATSHSQRRI